MKTIVWGVVGVLLFCNVASAQTPSGPEFGYQGQIRQRGVPVNGTCDFQFALWNHPTNSAEGNRLGIIQVVPNVAINNGLFSVELNAAGQFGPPAFNGDQRWLSVAARCPSGGGVFTPITPRAKISPVPYAQAALSGSGDGHSLDAADGDPTDVVYVDNDGNVGVGTTTPAHRLDIQGDVRGSGRFAIGGDAAIGLSGGFDTIFNLSETITDFSSSRNWSPFLSYITLDPNAPLIPLTSIYGHDFETTIAAGNTQDFSYVQGPYLAAFHLGDGDISYFVGGSMGAETFGAGTIQAQAGAYFFSDIGVSGVGTIVDNYGVTVDTGAYGPSGGGITNNYGISIHSPGVNRPIQNNYGLYLANQDVAVNRSYAIYSAGGQSYFQDPVGIGTDQPQALLHLSGTAGVDGIMFPDGTLQTTAAVGVGGGDSVWSLNGADAYYTAGRVGIGTSQPGARLDVRSGHDSYLRFDDAYGDLHFNGGADGTMGFFNEGDLAGRTSFVTAGAERFSILNDGRVGAGTTNPAGRFEAYAYATASGMVAVKGTTEPSFDLFGNFFQGGIGVWGDSPSNVGVMGTSIESIGVLGESQNYDGVRGTAHNADHGAVVGVHDGGGYAVAGFSTNNGFAGVWGNGTKNGVYGNTMSAADSGVFGRNDSSGWALYGYTTGAPFLQTTLGGTGVEGVSEGLGGYGVIGRSHNVNGVGVHAEAQNTNATAIWAYNPGGRSALLDGYVDINGALNVNGSGSVRVLTITGGADLAEPFEVNDLPGGANANPRSSKNLVTPPIRPGMVVVIDPDHPGELRLSDAPYDRKVAGIISGANDLSPGMVMKSTHQPLADGEHPIALTGRVWCHCDGTLGAIEPGDMLTTSSTLGHAMKAADLPQAQGAIIGKAMTRLNAGETGLVLVLVNLQ